MNEWYVYVYMHVKTMLNIGIGLGLGQRLTKSFVQVSTHVKMYHSTISRSLY